MSSKRLVKISLLCFLTAAVSPNGSCFFVTSAYAKTAKSSSGSKSVKNKNRKSKLKTSKQVGVGDVWERIRNGIRISVPNPVAGLEDINIPKTAITSAETKTINSPTGRLTTVIAPKKSVPAESQLSEKLRVKHVLNPYKNGSPEPDAVPEDRYTKLGRLKLGNKEKNSILNEKLRKKQLISYQEKSENAKSDSLFKFSTGRIRTRLGLTGDIKTGVAQNSKEPSDSGEKPVIATSYNPMSINNCSDLHKQEIVSFAKKGVLSSSYQRMLEQCRNKQIAINERITRQMGLYSKAYLNEISERARPFLFHIVDSLSKYNLPLDLALLPIVESAYQPTALSTASAAGIWQFIPSTGRIYDLEQNGLYDARLDVTASTHAAIRFLSGLRDRYKGDWLLALAAYNAGPGTVDAAMAQNHADGLDTDYWSLPLPAETQNYVPRLLALARIFSNPAGFGMKIRPLKNEPYFIKVKIDREADINQLVGKELIKVAKLANYDHHEFSLLNTAYRKPKLTKEIPLTFHMPIANANLLHRSLDFMAQSSRNQDEKWPVYPEIAFSSEAIQNKFRSPLVLIAMQDNQSWISDLKTKQPSDIPEREPHNNQNTKTTDHGFFTVHYLDKGETLKTLAEYHGLTESILREVNNLKRRENLALGQRLLIPLTEMAMSSMSKSRSSILFRGFNWYSK